MSLTIEYLNSADAAKLAEKVAEQRKKREWQFLQLGANTFEGVVSSPDGTIKGFADGKD